jgi:hypothetical protein
MHHGWKHWCNEDAKLCAEYATEGYIPGIIFNATTSRELLNYALHDVDILLEDIAKARIMKKHLLQNRDILCLPIEIS